MCRRFSTLSYGYAHATLAPADVVFRPHRQIQPCPIRTEHDPPFYAQHCRSQLRAKRTRISPICVVPEGDEKESTGLSETVITYHAPSPRPLRSNPTLPSKPLISLESRTVPAFTRHSVRKFSGGGGCILRASSCARCGV